MPNERDKSTVLMIGRCVKMRFYLRNIGEKYLKNLVKHMETNDIRARTHGRSGKKPHDVLSFEEIQSVVQFIKYILRIMTFLCRLLQEVGIHNQQLFYPVHVLRRTSMICMLKLVRKSPFVRLYSIWSARLFDIQIL